MVRIETLVIVHQGDKVLLGLKKEQEGKRNFGAGKWNGFGGGMKDKDNGSIERTAYRETMEECGIYIKGLEKIGETLYKFDSDEQDHLVHVYVVEDFGGEPTESDEMRPQWFHVDDIPYTGDQMWENDVLWMPYLLERKKFRAEICLNAKGKTLTHDIKEVERFE